MSSQPRRQPRGLCRDAWLLEKYKGTSAGGMGLRADCCHGKKKPLGWDEERDGQRWGAGRGGQVRGCPRQKEGREGRGEGQGIRSRETSGLMERQASGGRKGSGVGRSHCSLQGRRRVRLEGPRAQTEKIKQDRETKKSTMPLAIMHPPLRS